MVYCSGKGHEVWFQCTAEMALGSLAKTMAHMRQNSVIRIAMANRWEESKGSEKWACEIGSVILTGKSS